MEAHDKSQTLQQLSRMIQSLEDPCTSASRAVATGWDAVDRALCDFQTSHSNSQSASACHGPVQLEIGNGQLEMGRGGLKVGAIHEFLGPLPADALQDAGSPPVAPSGKQSSLSPACLLAWLARQAAAAMEGEVVWVGRRCWPNPQFLARAGLLERSLVVEAPDAKDRLWAIELALRSPAVAAVVGDAENFKLPATRRLELAARDSQSLVLLSRPARELSVSSAATTRWAVYRQVSDSVRPAWMLELLRCKGRQVSQGGRWPMEWDCAKGAVIIPPAMVDRLSSTPQAALRAIG